MKLNTRCPDCGTVFGASLEQMKLRKGYIRCINCAGIFDGYEAVVDEKSAEDYVPAALPQAPEDTLPPVTIPVRGRAPAVPARPEPTFAAPSAGPRSPHTLNDRGAGVFESDIEDDAPASDAPRIFVEPKNYRKVNDSVFLTDRRRVSSGRSGGLRWVLVLLILGLAALLLAYAFRMQLAAEVPWTRPWLERACLHLDCTVDYPQRIDRISIMDSSLRAAGAEAGQTRPPLGAADVTEMVLTVVMRNTYDKPQQWPALTLDLVDFSGAIVSRRILQPADYLDDQQLRGPFGAQQEVRLRVSVPVNGLRINGYQLGKYFPSKD
ncbi:hypothetical protein PuT2_02475 [Pusillimonas sp. T2]|uniref:zinc-ribbon and DUF3426 domain-containing protein n=1 Tax=Pusillimonas sp. T2 TaxID=1548123 RepID=UPI000B9C970D|nr:zinc-ribbon and DUF3426 domain-containing protein [Pusillimonas sp. T2]OXR50748.1 hypothetical protein PuT2_02475 [Pusillimonas sp. T2]